MNSAVPFEAIFREDEGGDKEGKEIKEWRKSSSLNPHESIRGVCIKRPSFKAMI